MLRDGGPGVIEALQALPNSEVVGVDPLSLEEIFKELARPGVGRPSGLVLPRDREGVGRGYIIGPDG